MNAWLLPHGVLFSPKRSLLSLTFHSTNQYNSPTYKYRPDPIFPQPFEANLTMFKQTSRAFSTNARIHPSYFLQTPRRIAMRWIPPTVAVVAVGYGLNSYRQNMVQRRLAMAEEAEKRAVEDRKRAAKLLDAYGDRSSLEELEKAMQVYEAQNQV
ncbi:uncharacterized protein CTRU02_208117 [Colletotrichum truncatum]|uniref:Uncharacterized protein n=1 Tax=Colletotrichum truncatum TaxID=5467 RepID=A0ACC3YVR0_COLTU|nr:uncharacterized protein CTRU02_14984 [Colletotrichum truncatum]KAF6781577.1 hypothetical protein CTRU02_14984 [Colletotrichum truncatum]